MKAGKEGPMQKNFGSALKKAIPEDAKGLNKMIQSKEGKEAAKNMGFTEDSSGALLMKKDNAPMMRMDNSAMKAMGKPAPVKMNTPKKHSQGSHEDHHGQEQVEQVQESSSDRPFYLDQSTKERIEGTDAEIKKLELQLKDFPSEATQERLDMLKGVLARLKAGGK